MVKYINVKEMRQHFGKIRKDLDNGISYILIYRSKPLAELKPIKEAKEENLLAKYFSNPPERIRSDKTSEELIRELRD